MSAAYIHNPATAHVCLCLQTLISLSAPLKQLQDSCMPYRITYDYRPSQTLIQTATHTVEKKTWAENKIISVQCCFKLYTHLKWFKVWLLILKMREKLSDLLRVMIGDEVTVQRGQESCVCWERTRPNFQGMTRKQVCNKLQWAPPRQWS